MLLGSDSTTLEGHEDTVNMTLNPPHLSRQNSRSSNAGIHHAGPCTHVVQCMLDDMLVCFPEHINNNAAYTTGLPSKSIEEYPRLRVKTGDESQFDEAPVRRSEHSNNSTMSVVEPKAKGDFRVPLEKILVQVHYQDLKHGSVVDNDYYTTLLPSKLPVSAWGAQAQFASIDISNSTAAADLLSPPPVSPLYATSLRRLLALYVCGKSAR